MNLLSSVQSSTCPTLENLDKVTVTLLILSAAKWTGGFFPFAVRTCPKLKSPENGHINCSTADISYKTVCLVTCNEGYEIEGNTKLTCQGTAQWDSKEPKCVGKYLIKLSLSVSECSIFWHAVTSEKHSLLIYGEATIGMRICLGMFYAGLRSWGGGKHFVNWESGQIIIGIHCRQLITKRLLHLVSVKMLWYNVL